MQYLITLWGEFFSILLLCKFRFVKLNNYALVKDILCPLRFAGKSSAASSLFGKSLTGILPSASPPRQTSFGKFELFTKYPKKTSIKEVFLGSYYVNLALCCKINFVSVKVLVTFVLYAGAALQINKFFSPYNKTLRWEGFVVWCTRVDELLNSIVDETSDINGWKNEY